MDSKSFPEKRRGQSSKGKNELRKKSRSGSKSNQYSKGKTEKSKSKNTVVKDTGKRSRSGSKSKIGKSDRKARSKSNTKPTSKTNKSTDKKSNNKSSSTGTNTKGSKKTSLKITKTDLKINRTLQESDTHASTESAQKTGKSIDSTTNQNKTQRVRTRFSTILQKHHRNVASAAILFRQVKALLWKNVLLKCRHIFSLVFELFFPITIVYFLAYSYSYGYKEETQPENGLIANETYYDTKAEFMADPKAQYNFYNPFYFVQNNEIANQIVKPFLRHLVDESYFNFSNVKEMDEYMMDDYPRYGLLLRNLEDNKLASGNINYVLKESAFERDLEIKPKKFMMTPNNIIYQLEFYSILIMYVQNGYLKQICAKNNISDCERYIKPIIFYRMPYPKHPVSTLIMEIDYNIQANIFIMAYCITFPILVAMFVQETKYKMKALMRMNGMPDFAYWLSHFIMNYSILFVHCIFITIFLFLFKYPMLSYTQPFLVFLFFILFSAQMLLLAMLISTFFQSPTFASMVSFFFWVLIIFPFYSEDWKEICETGIISTNALLFLGSMTPFGSLVFFFKNALSFESQQIPLTFFDINVPMTLARDFTILYVFIAMIISFPVYAFLIFYLDNCWPFQEFYKQPLFFIEPSFWFSSWQKKKKFPPMKKSSSKLFQPYLGQESPVFVLDNVSKTYKTKWCGYKPIIEQMNMRISGKSLTVLLGQNGAGKTTTMSMLTGITNATKGKIYVNGYNVATQPMLARQSMSFCPQENIFYDELTVYHHLRLFALLKKTLKSPVEEQIAEILAALDFEDKRNTRVSALSGGMKRKLALGMALIGDTETLVLDEPTSGMDPQTRRVVWDLLLDIRHEKNILLTTHFLEEADILGDRIIILNRGKVICDGSPHYLKTTLGTGHRLRIAKLPKFKTKEFLPVIRKIIPDARILSEIDTEVVFSLENKIDKKPFMQKLLTMFEVIEKMKKQLNYDSCGLTYSTLDDIFLKLGDSEKENLENLKLVTEKTVITRTQDLQRSSVLSQVKALLIKRFHYTKRSWHTLIIQLFVPCLLLFVFMKCITWIRRSLDQNDSEILMSTKDLYGEGSKSFYYGRDDLRKEYGQVIGQIDSGSLIFNEGIISLRNVSQHILDSVNNDVRDYSDHYIYGLGVGSDRYEVWINYEALQSYVLALRALYEAIVCKLLAKPKCDMIEMHRHYLLGQKNKTHLNEDLDIMEKTFSYVLYCIIMFPIVLPLIAASFSMFIVEENVSKARALQLLTPLTIRTYWLANFIFDMFSYLVVTILMIIIIFIFEGTENILEQKKLHVFLILLFGFGFSTIPWIYVLSFLFRRPSTSFTFLLVSIFLIGFLPNLMVGLDILLSFIFKMDGSFSDSFNFVGWIMDFVPIYSFLVGFQKISFISTMQFVCDAYTNDNNFEHEYCRESIADSSFLLRDCCPRPICKNCYRDYDIFSTERLGVARHMVMLYVSGITGFIFLTILEYFSLPSIMNFFWRPKPNNVSDSDVKAEVRRVEKQLKKSSSNDILLVSHLYKVFKKKLAVNDMSFGVFTNECFGLLGVNGAGKTTTFSMLVGEIVPDKGDAFFVPGKLSLKKNQKLFMSNIGYCPQFSALLETLTAYETLYFFGRLRGIPVENLHRDTTNLIQLVGLKEFANQCCGEYSGGNKRKLSLAIALIGSPPMLFLDEPSSGVDPSSRRSIWTLLKFIKDNFNCSIILTSHSMDECEALCSRIGIMVKGSLRCLGSSQHLRTKFGRGYIVVIMFKTENATSSKYSKKVENQIKKSIPSAKIQDVHLGLMTLHVDDPNEKWSSIFKKIIALDEMFDFENYNIMNTTLEQVFLMFAKDDES